MATEFEKIFKKGKTPPDGKRSITVTLRCAETRQQFEYTYVAKVGELYTNSGELRMKLMAGLDSLIQAFIRGLPIW